MNIGNVLKFELFFQRKKLDANRYATKKTIAQGMLDVALLTANASQLKYVLQVGEENHPFYTLMLSLIILSIILQVSIIEPSGRPTVAAGSDHNFHPWRPSKLFKIS